MGVVGSREKEGGWVLAGLVEMSGERGERAVFVIRAVLRLVPAYGKEGGD